MPGGIRQVKIEPQGVFRCELGLGSLGIAAAGTAAFAYQFLSPNVLYEPSPVVNMGKPESYRARFRHPDVDAGILSSTPSKGTSRAERGVHPPGMPDRVEAGDRHHRLPVPRK